MLQKPPSVSPGLTRRKLEFLAESIATDKSVIKSNQVENEDGTKEDMSIEKLYTNQCCQTDLYSPVRDLDSKKAFKPIAKSIVKSLTPDNNQKKKIPVFVPKPVKMLKSKENEKNKIKPDVLNKFSASSSRLTKSAPTSSTKLTEKVKNTAIVYKDNKQQLGDNEIIYVTNEETKKLQNAISNSVNNPNKKDESMNQYSSLVKTKRKSADSVNASIKETKKNEKLIRSKTSIDIKPPRLSKRGIVKGNDGWATVIRSRRSNPLTQSSSNLKPKSPFDIKKRFQVPSSASSMPALALDITSSPDKPETMNVILDKNDRPIISNAVVFPKKKRKPDKPLVPKNNRIIDQMRKEMLKDEIEERRICDEELLRNRQFFDEEMMLAREIRELENAESSCSDDMTQSDRYSDLLDNMILTERMYTINEIKALIQYGNESAIDSIAMPSWDINKSTDSIKQTYSVRQAKAHQKRQQLLQDKSTKVRELLKKVIIFIFLNLLLLLIFNTCFTNKKIIHLFLRLEREKCYKVNLLMKNA